MISKDTIKRTAVCYWSADDDCYLVESPLFDRAIGSGDTKQQAREMFVSMIDDAYIHLKSGKVLGYGKAGRPIKEGVQLNCKVREETHAQVTELSKLLEISQGEVVDVLLFSYLHTNEERSEGDHSIGSMELTTAVSKAVREALSEYKIPIKRQQGASKSTLRKKRPKQR